MYIKNKKLKIEAKNKCKIKKNNNKQTKNKIKHINKNMKLT